MHFNCSKRLNYFSVYSTKRQILKWGKTDSFHKCEPHGIYSRPLNNKLHLVDQSNSKYETFTS